VGHKRRINPLIAVLVQKLYFTHTWC